jgi:hypothetical protein
MPDAERERQRLAQETRNERHMWWWLAYFLFGIHIVAFVMIYAVTHAAGHWSRRHERRGPTSHRPSTAPRARTARACWRRWS